MDGADDAVDAAMLSAAGEAEPSAVCMFAVGLVDVAGGAVPAAAEASSAAWAAVVPFAVGCVDN